MEVDEPGVVSAQMARPQLDVDLGEGASRLHPGGSPAKGVGEEQAGVSDEGFEHRAAGGQFGDHRSQGGTDSTFTPTRLVWASARVRRSQGVRVVPVCSGAYWMMTGDLACGFQNCVQMVEDLRAGGAEPERGQHVDRAGSCGRGPFDLLDRDLRGVVGDGNDREHVRSGRGHGQEPVLEQLSFFTRELAELGCEGREHHPCHAGREDVGQDPLEPGLVYVAVRAERRLQNGHHAVREALNGHREVRGMSCPDPPTRNHI